MDDLNLEELKSNYKVSHMVGHLERLLREEEEIRTMMGGDDALHDIAKEELSSLEGQKGEVIKQIRDILEGEKAEEEFPNEIVLEIFF